MTWVEARGTWIKAASERQLLDTIAYLAKGQDTDENLGDTTERMQTVQWFATRGKRGKDWGGAGRYVTKHYIPEDT